MSTTETMVATASSSSETVVFPASSSCAVVSSDRSVRFHDECVLIPESLLHARRPRMVTKSYSLPLWKKKPQASAVVSDSELEICDDTHVVLKVPVPSFMSKARSPTRSAERRSQPLSPCLVYREPSSPIQRPVVRRPSLPLPTRPDLITIPLRACCPDCVTITEECLREGEEWKEKFTRGARRLRSASLNTTPCDTAPGFAAVSCRDKEAVVGAAFHGGLTINVDEVDKRRKSFESAEERREEPEQEDSSEPLSAAGKSDDTSPKDFGKASPIEEEEDEDQLFPLPSPRRTPTSSPVPSPNASTSCLGASASRDSLLNGAEGASDESGGSGNSIAGKGKGRCRRGLLTPDASPSQPNYVPPALKNIPTLPAPEPTQLPYPLASPTTPAKHPSSPIIIPPSLSRTNNGYNHGYHHQQSSSTSSTSTSSPPASPRYPEPGSSPKKYRPSFHIPRTSSFLRAGADVLKGMTSISGSPGGSALSA